MNPLDKTSPSHESLASFLHSTVLRHSCLLQQGGLIAQAVYSSLRSNSHIQERITFLEAATRLLNVYKSICGYTSMSIHTNKNSCAGISIVMFPKACFKGEKMRLLQNPWIPLQVQLLWTHTRGHLRFWHLLSPWWDPYRSYKQRCVWPLGSQGRAVKLDGLLSTGDGGCPHRGGNAALFTPPVLHRAGSPGRLAGPIRQPEPTLVLFALLRKEKSPPRPPTIQGSSAHLHTQEGDGSERIDATGSQTTQDWRRVVFFSE